MYILMYVYVHFNRFKVPCERGCPVTTFPILKRLDTNAVVLKKNMEDLAKAGPLCL